MDYRKYMKRIELKIGEIKAADKIDEVSWSYTVMNELNQMSVECANELQTETGTTFRKPPREAHLATSVIIVAKTKPGHKSKKEFCNT
jgi:hypothetical protein